jgi:hypothetical protein
MCVSECTGVIGPQEESNKSYLIVSIASTYISTFQNVGSVLPGKGLAEILKSQFSIMFTR